MPLNPQTLTILLCICVLLYIRCNFFVPEKKKKKICIQRYVLEQWTEMNDDSERGKLNKQSEENVNCLSEKYEYEHQRSRPNKTHKQGTSNEV